MLMMNKFFSVISTAALALVLTACNNNATPTKDTSIESSLTLENVYNQAIARQEDIKSIRATIDLSQDMTYGVDDLLQMNVDSQMTIDMMTKPLAMHLSGKMSMPNLFGDGTENSSMPIEMYMKENQGFYMKDSTSERWLSIPIEQFDAILEQTVSSPNAKEQLEQLKPYIHDFTLTQTEDTYVLALQAKGDQYEKLIQSTLNQSVPTPNNSLTDLTIEQANYTIVLNKKTFDTTKLDMHYILLMDMEGQTSKIDSKSVVTYTDINHLETIDIPQTIIDQATTIEN